MTKHSNLPNIHVIFHLIYDDSEELNGQSPEIVGYRSILKTAQNCKINHLKIPINLESHSNPQNIYSESPIIDARFIKRSQVVLKQTKGILNEIARSKTWPRIDFKSWEPATLVFDMHVYPSNMEFREIRDFLVELFSTL
jgi:hypothetical protein